MKRIVLGLMGIVFLCCASSQANILVSFNFDNGTGNASTVATGLAATPFTIAVGSANWLDHPGNGKAIGAVGFKTSGNYFTFTLTVDPGYVLNVTDLHLDNTKESQLNAQHWRAVYKIGNGLFTTDGPTGNVAETWSTETKTVSGLGYLQNTTLTFRISPTSASKDEKHWYLDNVIVNGTVTAIPEPLTAAILALGGLTLLRKRK